MINPTDPAFSVPASSSPQWAGMDLRTYMATHCAAAMLTRGPWDPAEVADAAIKQADAVIERLNAK